MKSDASEYIVSETHFHFSIALLLYGMNFFVKNSKMHKIFPKSMNGIAGRSMVGRGSKSKSKISIYVGSSVEINVPHLYWGMSIMGKAIYACVRAGGNIVHVLP